MIPYLLPPYCFVIKTGKKLSKTETAIATIPVTISKIGEEFVYREKCEIKSPSHANGAPGRIGTTVPINPTIRQTPPSSTNKISIQIVLVTQQVFKV